MTTTVIVGIILLFLLGCVFGYLASGAASPSEQAATKAVPEPEAAVRAKPKTVGRPKPKAAGAAKPKAAKRAEPKAAARAKTKTAARPKAKAAARSQPKDDLKRLSGVGPVIEKKLNRMGVKRYEQIAKWTAADIKKADEKLNFKGRIQREKWVSQAKTLARGGETEFSKAYKK